MRFFNIEMCEELSADKVVITTIKLNESGKRKMEKEEARLKEYWDKVDAKID